MSYTYVPTKPCGRGHSLRYVSGGQCVECRRAQARSEDKKVYYREQRAKDPERFKAYRDNWTKTNPAKNLWDKAKYRASQSELAFDIEPSDVVIPETCPVLGIPMEKPTLDRKDNSKGYIKGNVFVISHRANRIKSDATRSEIEAILRYMS